MRQRESYEAASSEHFLVRPEALIRPIDEFVAQDIVHRNYTVGSRILHQGNPITHGMIVGVRPNLNIQSSTGIILQTIHHGTEGQLLAGVGMHRGRAISYASVVRLSDARFNVNQIGRARIASGLSKFPMASCDGRVVIDESTDHERFNGVLITFNPRTGSHFYDRDGNAVRGAEHVTIVGSKVFARGWIDLLR